MLDGGLQVHELAAGAPRLIRAPLWAHTLALTLALLALVPLLGGPRLFSPDEGVAMAQARLAPQS